MRGEIVQLMRLAVAFLTACLCGAQPTVAPSQGHSATEPGKAAGNYDIVQHFETGYRFRTVDGNLGKYRSDVNYGNGVRLLSGYLSLHSRDGHGRRFDELVLTTHGLGNDPYQSASLRIQKDRRYRYELLWRSNDYFNPALTIAEGRHARNTQRRWQDHELTLLPQAPIRLMLGYSRNSHDGEALTTTQPFDARGDEFNAFARLKSHQNEYRLGWQMRLFGLDMQFTRIWENYTEATDSESGASQSGSAPTTGAVLTAFRRTEPYRGSTPGWRAHIAGERGRWLTMNGRLMWVYGKREFVLDETAAGRERFGLARNRQVLVFGSGRRPASMGRFSLFIHPGNTLTVYSHTAFHNSRMEGDSVYQQFDNAARVLERLRFQFLGIRMLTESTGVNYAPVRWVGLHGGYQFSNRRVRSIEHVGLSPAAPLESTQENTLHAGLAGVRLHPAERMRISLDTEIGRADRPFYPISERRYHAFSARAQYRHRKAMVAGTVRTHYNANPVSFSMHSARTKVFSLDAGLAPEARFGLDGGFANTRLETTSAIAYFAGSRFLEGGRSHYRSDLWSAHLMARVSFGSRAQFQAGYTRVEDRARGVGRVGLPGLPANLNQALLQAQAFPMVYQAPLARFTLRLHEKLNWNAGFQYYRYREDLVSQNYRAHTGFTSLTWSF